MGIEMRSGLIENRTSWFFVLFCVWSFVLLCRPQDLFSSLSQIRPALVLGMTVAAIFLISHASRWDQSILANRQVKRYLVLFLLMIIGVPFSIYPKASFTFLFPYYFQVVVYLLFFVFVMKTKDKMKTLLGITLVGVTIYAIFAVNHGMDDIGRVSYGDTFDPNDMAFFLVSFIPFHLIFLFEKSLPLRLASLAALTTSLALLLMTGSRGGFLSLLVMGMLLLLGKSIKRTGKFALVGLMAIVVLNLDISFDRYTTLADLGGDYNLTSETGRKAIWTSGLRVMFSRPLTGVGVGCFGEAIGRDRADRGLESTRWQTAHNSLIQVGTETGVLGFVLFGLLSVQAMRIFWSVKQEAADPDMARIGEAAVIGFAGHFVAAMFLSQAYSVYWAFYIALSAALSRLALKDGERWRFPPMRKTAVRRLKAV